MDQENVVDQKLDAIAESLHALDTKLERHLVFCEMQCRRVQEHHETLYGNGNDGLKVDVARFKESQAIGAKMLWTIVALVSVIVSGIVVAGLELMLGGF